MRVPDRHQVNGTLLKPPFPTGFETAIFGMGCFWGAEQRFWQLEGVYTTAVGYAGGELEHPTYKEVSAGNTNHAEVVLVVYDPQVISYETLLKTFWEGHNPTRGFRQQDNVKFQYLSVIFTTSVEQTELAQASFERYQKNLDFNTDEQVSTEIMSAPTFYYAEARHQQYKAKRY